MPYPSVGPFPNTKPVKGDIVAIDTYLATVLPSDFQAALTAWMTNPAFVAAVQQIVIAMGAGVVTPTGTFLAQWLLNETAGTTAADASGNGHPGTYTGGFTLNQAAHAALGGADKSVAFNGTTGYVTVPSATALSPLASGNREFSLTVYFTTPSALTGSQYLVSKGNAGNYEWALLLNGNNPQLITWGLDGSTRFSLIAGTTALATSTDYVLTAVYRDGVSGALSLGVGAGTIAQIATSSSFVAGVTPGAGGAAVNIARRDDGVGYFGGRISRVDISPSSGISGGTVVTGSAAKVYQGAYLNSGNFSLLGAWEQAAGKAMSIYHFGHAWKIGGVDNDFPAALMDSIRAHGTIPMLNWGSWNLGDGINQPAFKLTNITRGDFDAYIDRFAAAAAAWGHPFFLRMDHEQNIAGQFSWSWGPGNAQGNTAADFGAFWRHVKDRCVAQGATNITWVWSPNIYFEGGSLAQKFGNAAPGTDNRRGDYPGDSYVDWLGLDGYAQNGDTSSFASIFGDALAQMAAINSSKPIMIAETGACTAGAMTENLKAAWLTDALGTQLPARLNIRAWVYFNWDLGGGSPEITTSPQVTAAYSAALASPYYASNTFGALAGSTIAPLP
jgi:hypothetical protein